MGLGAFRPPIDGYKPPIARQRMRPPGKRLIAWKSLPETVSGLRGVNVEDTTISRSEVIITLITYPTRFSIELTDTGIIILKNEMDKITEATLPLEGGLILDINIAPAILSLLREPYYEIIGMNERKYPLIVSFGFATDPEYAKGMLRRYRFERWILTKTTSTLLDLAQMIMEESKSSQKITINIH